MRGFKRYSFPWDLFDGNHGRKIMHVEGGHPTTYVFKIIGESYPPPTFYSPPTPTVYYINVIQNNSERRMTNTVYYELDDAKAYIDQHIEWCRCIALPSEKYIVMV